MAERKMPYEFDVPYGLASAAVSGTGITVVATTRVNYHGASIIAGTTKAAVKIFDNASASSGNIIDAFVVNAGLLKAANVKLFLCKYGSFILMNSLIVIQLI